MSDEGEVREGGRRCSHRFNVKSAGDWDAEHAVHGEKTWKPLEDAPEGYKYAWICCPCGSQNLRRKPDAEIAHD